MATAVNLIRRHPLPTFFTLAFIISWSACFVVVGPDGIPVTADQAVVAGMAMLLGPSIAGILMTGLASGRAGYRELVCRLLRWRVGIRWYLVALLIAPLSTVAVLLVLSLFSPEFLPLILTTNDMASLVLAGIVAGLMVGFFEELGWTGFAIPRMRPRYGVFRTGLIVGLLWGAWHFPLFWESDSFSGALPLALLLARLFSWLPAYRILMVWVYDGAESLLVAILMHVSLVATLAIYDPPLEGALLLTYILARAAVLWGIVGAVAATQRRAVGEGRNRPDSPELPLPG